MVLFVHLRKLIYSFVLRWSIVLKAERLKASLSVDSPRLYYFFLLSSFIPSLVEPLTILIFTFKQSLRSFTTVMMQTNVDVDATRNPTQPSRFLRIRCITFSRLPRAPYSWFPKLIRNMIIRLHHIFMLPVDCITICRAICTVGCNESYRTSDSQIVLWKVSEIDLRRCRFFNFYHVGAR